MTKCYFELRKPGRSGGLTTDITRHFHTRQHLGNAVVVCGEPMASLSVACKQWLKLSRNIQKQRASTLNADKILKYTHAVTHMQHMRFTSKLPLDEPEADVFFLRAAEVETIPADCFSVYLAEHLSNEQLTNILAQLPAGALVIDYAQTRTWTELGLLPKQNLEDDVHQEWAALQHFLTTYHIDIKTISGEQTHNIEAMEEALDILLGASRKFIQIASDFQHALELARPLRLAKDIREQYDAAVLLAHRVQALMPGAFTQSFLESYSEEDTFFLYDRGRELSLQGGESLREAIAHQVAAGRLRLAQALHDYYLASDRQVKTPSFMAHL